MGSMIGHVVRVTPGVLACVVAYALGTPLWGATAAFALYAASLAANRVAPYLLLFAPLVLALSAPATALPSVAGVVWTLIAVAAATPFFWRAGQRIPWQGFTILGVIAPILTAALVVFPWAPSSVASDIAPRAQIVLLAVAAMVMLALEGHLPVRRPLT